MLNRSSRAESPAQDGVLPHQLTYALIFLLAIWCGFNWFDTLRHVVGYYDPLPTFDYWRVIEDFPRLQKGELSALWRPHNQHRIVFPELIFAADALWLKGRQIFPLLLNVVLYAATVWLCVRPVLRERELPTLSRVALALVTGIIAGWPLCVFVLGTPFLLQWTMLQAAVVLSFSLMAKMHRGFDRAATVGVVVCAVVATFTSANGLLVWPLTMGIAMAYRWKKQQLAFLLAPGILAISLFFAGFPSQANTSIADCVRHPVYLAGFILSYLGMPFGVIRNPMIGIFFGLCGLGLWATSLAWTLRRRVWHSEISVITFTYGAFLLLTAGMTAAGRLDVANGGFLAAKAGRYVTIPLLGWALLMQYVFYLQLKGSGKGRWRWTGAALTAVVLAFMQIRLGRWLRTNDRAMAAGQVTSLSIESGLLDDSLIKNIFPEPSFVRQRIPVLRANGLSVFAGDDARLLGHPLPAHAEEPTTRIAGAITSVKQVEGGLMVEGQAQDTRGMDQRLILISNQDGIVVGFGRHMHVSNAAARDSWVGFVNQHWTCLRLQAWRANP